MWASFPILHETLEAAYCARGQRKVLTTLTSRKMLNLAAISDPMSALQVSFASFAGNKKRSNWAKCKLPPFFPSLWNLRSSGVKKSALMHRCALQKGILVFVFPLNRINHNAGFDVGCPPKHWQSTYRYPPPGAESLQKCFFSGSPP